MTPNDIPQAPPPKDEVPELKITPSGVGRLACQAWETNEGLVLELSGSAEVPDREALGGLLRAAHETALARGASRVEVDLRNLRFMNSSCFKDFVTWLTRIQESEAARRYRIHFNSNPSIRWQRTSLHALASFAVDLVTFS